MSPKHLEIINNEYIFTHNFTPNLSLYQASSLVCGSGSLDGDLRGRVVAGAAAVSWVDVHLARAPVAVLTNHSAVLTMDRGPMRAHLAPVGGGGPAPCCPGPLLAAPWPPPAPAPHPPVLYGVLPGDGGRLARWHAVALRAPVLGTISLKISRTHIIKYTAGSGQREPPQTCA